MIKRGRLRPIHVARQIEAILAVRMRLVFVRDGPEEDVVERAVTRKQIAQPKAFARRRPLVRVSKGSTIKIEQNEFDVHSASAHLVEQRVEAAKKNGIEAVEVRLARRPAPRPERGIHLRMLHAPAHVHPHKVESLPAPDPQILRA